MNKTTDVLVCRLNGSDEPKPRRITEALEKLDKLIWKMVNNFHLKVPHLDINDLYQQGRMGVIIAWQKFDTDRDIAFITYANWWILKHIQLFCCKNEYSISLNAQNQKLYKELCMSSSDSNAITPNSKNSALAQLAKNGSGLAKKLTKDEFSEEDVNLEKVEINNSASPLLEKLLTKLRNNLSPLEYFILLAAKGLSHEEPLTTKEICNKLGVGKTQVKQCLDKHTSTIEVTLSGLA